MADNFIPLPADLPEDWTPGQIVSPEGTDVGLTKQHGYNYLNKAVNDAQREINRLAVGSVIPIVETEGDGINYTAQVPVNMELGMLLVIVPNTPNKINDPYLKIEYPNSFYQAHIYLPVSGSSGKTNTGKIGWMATGAPILLQWSKYGWMALSYTIPDAETMINVVGVAHGGTGLDSLIGHDYGTCRVRAASILAQIPSSLYNGQISFVYNPQ